MSAAVDGTAVALALAAAASFGVANVVQMRVARRTESAGTLDIRFLGRLLADPVWLLGLLTSAAAYFLQGAALFLAPVVLVQPLIVTELLFALPLAARLGGTRLRRREWIGIAQVTVGLALLVAIARPRGTHTEASTSAWIAMIGLTAVWVALMAGIAQWQRKRPTVRGSALAAGAAGCFGLMSVVTRTVGHQFDNNGIAELIHPLPYLLPLLAGGGLLLSQTAFKVAPLSVSLPLIDLGEPILGSVLAVVFVGDTFASGTGGLTALSVAGIIVIVGVALLDSSALVRQAHVEAMQAEAVPT